MEYRIQLFIMNVSTEWAKFAECIDRQILLAYIITVHWLYNDAHREYHPVIDYTIVVENKTWASSLPKKTPQPSASVM